MGRSPVVAGRYQSPQVHAIAHMLNQTLGNTGVTVVYTDPVEANPIDQTASIRNLVADIQNGAVDALLILGGNPVYDTPVDLNFLSALQRVGALRSHLGLYCKQRNRGVVPLACARGARPRILERRPRVGRNGLSDPALDRAHLQRQNAA